MCASLGANLEYGPNFRPFFTNPATGCNIYTGVPELADQIETVYSLMVMKVKNV
jgi:hypothetical protein